MEISETIKETEKGIDKMLNALQKVEDLIVKFSKSNNIKKNGIIIELENKIIISEKLTCALKSVLKILKTLKK